MLPRGTRPSGPTRGRIVAIDEFDAGAVVEVACAAGRTRQVPVGIHPDPAGAAQFLKAHLRASWVLFDLGPRPRATVGILGNRVPGRLPVSLATGLGLAGQGVPAYLAGGGS